MKYNNVKKAGASKSRPKFKEEKSKEITVDENLIYGRNAVIELLESERSVEKIYVGSGDKEGSVLRLIAMAKERKIPLIEQDKSRLDKMVSSSRHQGVVAVASEMDYATVDDVLSLAEEKGEKPFVLILDGVEDPHNLGAIIRCAECAGVHGIIIPKRRAVGLTSTVAKVSAGALMHVKVVKVTNISETIEELKEKGLWIYAADMDGEEVYKTDLKGSVGLVLGSEGFGISRLVKEKCDFTVSIPQWGVVNSLNVSCACAVITAEIARQRHSD